MRVRVVYTLVACCAILVSILVFPPDAKTIERVNCTDWIPRAPGSAQVLRACWIDQPTVTRRMTEYRDVTFAPGDVVTVSGGGCVQTGGVGDTWKRYIDPQANSGTLYHGEILIPGITAGLDRIQRYINTPMRVPTGIDPSQLYLRLGYEDDDYGDNGYYDHDDGTGDQCRGIGPAFLSIVAERNVPPQAPPP